MKINKKWVFYEVFNLCCKYDVIDFWHGKLVGISNPAKYIKDKILTFNLQKDLKIGRIRSCAFTDIFLKSNLWFH